jgi:hypothetical protein
VFFSKHNVFLYGFSFSYSREWNEELKYHNRKKLENHIDELNTYIENNCHLIPNYGERWRYGEAISTGFVESTINEVVAKRMVKKQQMQWTQESPKVAGF